MNEVMDIKLERLLIAIVATGILLLWRWSVLGWRHLAASVHGEQIRTRNIAVSFGLALCFMATISTLWFPFLLSGPLTAIAALVHSALEPSRETFWHHRRVRMLGIMALVGIALLMSWFFPSPFLPLLGATFIFHVHHRQNRRLMGRLLLEIDQLTRRNLSLTADTHNDRIINPESGDDILSKAS